MAKEEPTFYETLQPFRDLKSQFYFWLLHVLTRVLRVLIWLTKKIK